MSIDHLLKYLDRLSTDKPPRLYHSLDKVFECAFYIGPNIQQEKDEEKKTQIASYFNKSVTKIDNYLFRKGNSFVCDHVPYIMTLRSGLQFIMDYYNTFKDADGCKLQNCLDYLIENQTIEILDESLYHWKKTGVVTEDNATISACEITRPINIPSSHWWWFD